MPSQRIRTRQNKIKRSRGLAKYIGMVDGEVSCGLLMPYRTIKPFLNFSRWKARIKYFIQNWFVLCKYSNHNVQVLSYNIITFIMTLIYRLNKFALSRKDNNYSVHDTKRILYYVLLLARRESELLKLYCV